MSSLLCFCVIFLAVSASPTQPDPNPSFLPVVDLGYVLQRATSYNYTSGTYNFSNIRYAQPPVGELRFQAPQSPEINRTVHTGENGHICYQAIPNWFNSVPLVTPQLVNATVNSTYANASEHVIPLSPSQIQLPMPNESEDCLFLVVHVPEKTFYDRHNDNGAAVIVWIHGGGLTMGWKDDQYDPSGLLAQSVLQTGKEVIFVALNYRLGAFGWSGGPSLQWDGVANAGLLDQRFAIDVGESAGALSVLAHLTSYGGEHGPVPFQQSLTQSALGIANPPSVGEDIFQSLLRTANIASVQEARALSSEELRVTNYIQVSGSQWGSFTYIPVIDGTYVPNQPIRSLLDGKFHQNVRIMQGHNANEGFIFTPPYTDTASGYDTFVSTLLNSTDIEQVTQTLYPPIFDGSYGYINNIQRAALTVGNLNFVCASTALTRAVDNCTYSYIFEVPPAIHTEDLAYTFYTGPTQPQDPNSMAAVNVQRWVASFAVEGKPAAIGMEEFGEYGQDGMVQTVALIGVGREVDPAVAQRCDFWFGSAYK
ncbi:hypothetical protein MMC27_002072 [Xylographa pallens]|nr:hypothetical protein [Xylographa pallens]